jgi:hypothetical protein
MNRKTGRQIQPRKTALALAVLLFALSVPAATGACCAAGGPTERTARSMDCCGAMLECPTSRLVSTGAVQSADSGGTAGLQTADSVGSLDMAPSLPRLADSPRPGALGGGPPLYRLHAQLLI